MSNRQNDRICTHGILLAVLKVFQSSELEAFIQAKGSGFGARAMLKDAIAAWEDVVTKERVYVKTPD